MRGENEIHRMDLPKTVIVGEGILNRLSEIYGHIREGMEKIVIITGPNVYKIVGEEIDPKILDIDKRFFAYRASWEEIYRIEKEIKKLIDSGVPVDIIIGIGGGKVIDVAKMIAFRLNKSFVSIPTTPSHDGIASQLVSIRGGGRAYSYVTKPPTAVIVDIEIIKDTPHKFIASGVGDAIAKITAVKDWQLARDKKGEYYGEYAASLALLGAELVKRNSEKIGSRDPEAIRTLVEALISDGVAAGIAGSSRPCSGSEHLFSHALDLYGEKHALHGQQVGIGTILMAYLHGLDHEEIADTLRKASAPTNYKELGVRKEDVIKAFVKAREIRPDRYTILNEYSINKENAEKICRKTGVI